jgi:hypothetical protein
LAEIQTELGVWTGEEVAERRWAGSGHVVLKKGGGNGRCKRMRREVSRVEGDPLVVPRSRTTMRWMTSRVRMELVLVSMITL